MQNNINILYKKIKQRKKSNLIILTIFLIFITIYTTTLGVANSTFLDCIIAFKKNIFGENLTTTQKIIINLRFPRVVMAILVGGGLSIAGTVMQGITRNPLVSPFTVGISSSASFGASLAIVFAFSFFGNSDVGVISNAFIFSLICTLLVFFLSSSMKVSPQAIVLCGIALNYFCQSLGAGVQFLADDATLSRIIHWTFGSLNGIEIEQVYIVAIFIIPTCLILYIYHKSFTIMAVNDDELLITMGIDSKKVRLIGGILSAFITATIISFTGVIGFVGLISPHISRNIVGNDYKYLLMASLLVGAILVLLSDTIGRILFSPVIIPVGIVISFLGVPIFLKQIMKKRSA